MDLEIKKERDTPLLSRKRVTLIAEYEGATPKRIDMRKDVAKKLDVEEKLVILKHIYTKFGSQKAKIIAHIYNNEEDLKKIEDSSLLAKHGYAVKKKEAAEEKK